MMYHFIVNKKSRTGKTAKVWEQLETVLKEKEVSYQVYTTKYKGHAKELAEKISGRSKETVTMVVVGGDGTMNEVVNGIRDFSKVTVGYIPMGSGNDLARGLGISREPLEALERVLHMENTKAMDLGCLTYGENRKEYFAISSGIGLDAYVCKEVECSALKKILNALGIGNLTYVCLTIKSLFTMPVTDTEIQFEDEEKREVKNVIFAAAMNQRGEGGGVPMSPDATAFDGELSVCLVYGIPRWRTFFLLPFLVCGKHIRFHGVEVVNCKCCMIHTKKRFALHTDGEYHGMHQNVRMECMERKLNILL